MIGKILRKSLPFGMKHVEYLSLRCIAFKSDQKGQNHADFTSRKLNVDSTTKQFIKQQSDMINKSTTNTATNENIDSKQKLNQTLTDPLKIKNSLDLNIQQVRGQKPQASDQAVKDKKNPEKVSQQTSANSKFAQIEPKPILNYKAANWSPYLILKYVLNSIWNNFMSFIAISIALMSFLFQFKHQKWQKKTFQQGQQQKAKKYTNLIKEKYSVIKQDQPYIESPIYDQMKSCIQEKPIVGNTIKLVAGCPGIGKTTVTKKILQQMKSKGQKVYYFSFQIVKGGTLPLIQQFYTLMFGLLEQFEGQQNYKQKRVKVVIDDINKLEKYSSFQQVMKFLYTSANTEEIDIICISSSSEFIQKQEKSSDWRSYFQKSGQINIIQDNKKDQQVRQFQKKVSYQLAEGLIKKVLKDKIEYDNPIVSALADLKVSTRTVARLTRYLINKNIYKDEKQSLKFISNYQKNAIQESKKKIKSIIETIPSKDAAIELVTNISFVKEHLETTTCTKIKPDIFGSGPSVNIVLDILQKENLLIFCRPRTRLEAEAFKLYRESLNKHRQNQK